MEIASEAGVAEISCNVDFGGTGDLSACCVVIGWRLGVMEFCSLGTRGSEGAGVASG